MQEGGSIFPKGYHWGPKNMWHRGTNYPGISCMGAPKGGCQNYGYVTLARGTKTLLAIDRRTANILYYFDDPHSGFNIKKQ